MADGNNPSPIDRELQRSLLVEMRSAYPGKLRAEPPVDRRSFIANLLYLEQHGLCESGVVGNSDGSFRWAGGSTITAKGLDFLEDDGGLSAVLGVVTVRVHADTIRDLLTAKVEETAIPTAEKSRLKSAIKGLSETALKEATTVLVQAGL